MSEIKQEKEQPKEKKVSEKEKRRGEIKEIKEKQEKMLTESMDIKNYVDLDMDTYFEMNKCISKIMYKLTDGLIIEGDAGIGKTTTVMKKVMDKVKELNLDPEKSIGFCGGKITPALLYIWLNEHQDCKYKIIDDPANLFDSLENLATLKGLFQTGVPRIVSYNTTKPLEDSEGRLVDLSYEEKNAIIIITNHISVKSPKIKKHIEAVLSRVDHCIVSLTREELLKVLYKITMLPYKDLSKEERLEVFEYLKSKTSEGTINCNIRTLKQMFANRMLSKIENDDDWKKLSEKLLSRIDVGKLIMALHERIGMKDSDIFKEVQEATGISKATYYRIKSDLGLSVRTGSRKEAKAIEKKEEKKTNG